jgi:uncharacterized cupin superfamily protein
MSSFTSCRDWPSWLPKKGEIALSAGTCAGFQADDVNAHHLVNRSLEDVYCLEIGGRSAGDVVSYPDDVQADGHYVYRRKDGSSVG